MRSLLWVFRSLVSLKSRTHIVDNSCQTFPSSRLRIGTVCLQCVSHRTTDLFGKIGRICRPNSRKAILSTINPLLCLFCSISTTHFCNLYEFTKNQKPRQPNKSTPQTMKIAIITLSVLVVGATADFPPSDKGFLAPGVGAVRSPCPAINVRCLL